LVEGWVVEQAVASAEAVTSGRPSSHLHLRRNLLDPQRVRELSRLRTAPVIRDTALCWAWILAAWATAATIETWWAIAAAIVVVGNRFYALFIIGHDGMHRRLFSSTRTNDLFTDVFVLAPIGAINRINNRNHLRHHQHLASEDDPDRHKHGCFNKTTPLQVVGYLTGATSVLRTALHVFTGGSGDRQRDPDRPRYGVRDLAVLAACQAALITGLTLAFGWWGYPLMWLVPVYAFTILADNLRTFVEHSQTEADHLADAHRLVTNAPGLLERTLLAPLHMHCHAAHHLWPSIPYYNLPAADAEMRRSPLADQIEWRGSYLGYLWRYTRALPIAGCGDTAAPAAGAA
jgi:fatty acid desaturase